MSSPQRSLLLDFGGVCLLTPFELHAHTERHYGLAPGTLDWLGPLDLETDSHWRQIATGQLTEREYWRMRSAEVGALIGQPDLDTKTLFDPIFDLDEDIILRPQMISFVDEERRRGRAIGILTNDMADFQTAEWIARIRFLKQVDVIVDGSLTGFLKPHPRAYELGCEALGSRPEDTVFVDDQPTNIAGAERAGLITVWFDVRDPAGSVARAKAALG